MNLNKPLSLFITPILVLLFVSLLSVGLEKEMKNTNHTGKRDKVNGKLLSVHENITILKI